MRCFFLVSIKKALLSRTKNITIRISDEIGKYKVGEIYSAKSYAGKDWNIKIKILKVLSVTLGELSELGIPRRSIEATRQKEKISFDEDVELIRFEVV